MSVTFITKSINKEERDIPQLPFIVRESNNFYLAVDCGHIYKCVNLQNGEILKNIEYDTLSALIHDTVENGGIIEDFSIGLGREYKEEEYIF